MIQEKNIMKFAVQKWVRTKEMKVTQIIREIGRAHV